MSNFPKCETPSLTGLRARQKALRHERILDAALQLFREAGYDAVRTEDIAAAADVSVGTLYNYFENKGDLLLALVTLEVEEVLEQGGGCGDIAAGGYRRGPELADRRLL